MTRRTDGAATLSTGDDVELAGNFPTIEYTENNTTVRFNETGNGRQCGQCQLCCKLVPVPVIQKPAGKRCKHARHGKGCTIYATRPFDCRSWTCRWMADRANTEGMSRPDRSHFVVDIIPDQIKQKFESGAERDIGVIQVWIDPAFPEAAKSDELRRYMAHMAEKFGYPTIIRWNARDAYVVFPPAICADGQWHQMSGNVTPHNEWERMLFENWEVVTE
jgi:hypothetical protein